MGKPWKIVIFPISGKSRGGGQLLLCLSPLCVALHKGPIRLCGQQFCAFSSENRNSCMERFGVSLRTVKHQEQRTASHHLHEHEAITQMACPVLLECSSDRLQTSAAMRCKTGLSKCTHPILSSFVFPRDQTARFIGNGYVVLKSLQIVHGRGRACRGPTTSIVPAKTPSAQPDVEITTNIQLFISTLWLSMVAFWHAVFLYWYSP